MNRLIKLRLGFAGLVKGEGRLLGCTSDVEELEGIPFTRMMGAGLSARPSGGLMSLCINPPVAQCVSTLPSLNVEASWAY